MQAETSVLMNVEQQVSTERLQVASLRAKYEQLSSMTDEQIMRSIATLEIPDNTIAQTLPAVSGSVLGGSQVAQFRTRSQPSDVKFAQAKKNVMQTQLRDQIIVLRKTLKNQPEDRRGVHEEPRKPVG